MQLYKEILTQILSNQEIHITFPNLNINPTVIIQSESYQALQKIKAVIHDDSLTDNECFMKIEEIICIFEALGSNEGRSYFIGRELGF